MKRAMMVAEKNKHAEVEKEKPAEKKVKPSTATTVSSVRESLNHELDESSQESLNSELDQDKATDFVWFLCPNCNGNRYGSTTGKGFRSNGPAMPSCVVCNNEGRLVICYTCNAIQKCDGVFEGSYQCKGCHGKLTCVTHKWEELHGEGGDRLTVTRVACTNCKAIKPLAPKGWCGNNHTWLIQQSGAICKKCGVKADL